LNGDSLGCKFCADINLLTYLLLINYISDDELLDNESFEYQLNQIVLGKGHLNKFVMRRLHSNIVKQMCCVLFLRAFDHIFETIQVSVGIKYLVHASYLEIYNEEIRDLLGKDAKHKLDLKEHPDKGVYVQG